jgi:ATP synthase subunit C.
MTMLIQITLAITLVLSIIIPFGTYLIGQKNTRRYKTALGVNVFFFFGTMIIASAIMLVGKTDVFAAATSSDASLATGMGYLAAALVTGLSCIGGGVAVASAASAALGAISEDQSILGKSLIFVGLAEGIALYGLIISFMILGAL